MTNWGTIASRDNRTMKEDLMAVTNSQWDLAQAQWNRMEKLEKDNAAALARIEAKLAQPPATPPPTA